MDAYAATVWTFHGAFVVTQECIFTPLIPLYVAGALSAPLARRPRALALAATPFLFFALGVSRLLVLAVPVAVIGSYSTAIHAFSQTLLALVLENAAPRPGDYRPPPPPPIPTNDRGQYRRGVDRRARPGRVDARQDRPYAGRVAQQCRGKAGFFSAARGRRDCSLPGLTGETDLLRSGWAGEYQNHWR